MANPPKPRNPRKSRQSPQPGKTHPPKGPRISREQALDARPLQTTVLARQALPDGGQRLTVRFRPTGLQSLIFRVPETAIKKFDLDAMGVRVLQMCDGQTNVRQITQEFAREYRVSDHEAQKAVTVFLQTMIRKGLIVMEVEKNG